MYNFVRYCIFYCIFKYLNIECTLLIDRIAYVTMYILSIFKNIVLTILDVQPKSVRVRIQQGVKNEMLQLLFAIALRYSNLLNNIEALLCTVTYKIFTGSQCVKWQKASVKSKFRLGF
jgi:hypothetical protein